MPARGRHFGYLIRQEAQRIIFGCQQKLAFRWQLKMIFLLASRRQAFRISNSTRDSSLSPNIDHRDSGTAELHVLIVEFLYVGNS